MKTRAGFFLLPLTAALTACAPIGVAVKDDVHVKAAEDLPIRADQDVPVRIAETASIELTNEPGVRIAQPVRVEAVAPLPVELPGRIAVEAAQDMPVRMTAPVPIALTGPITIQLSGAGTQYEGTYISASLMDLIKEEETTADWILAVLGEPTARATLRDGTEIWKWVYQPVRHEGNLVSVLGFGEDEEPEPRPIMAFVRLRGEVVIGKWRSE